MKSSETLLRALGTVDERYIQEYADSRLDRPARKRRGTRFAALVAAVVMALASIIGVAAAADPEAEWVQMLNQEIALITGNYDAIDNGCRTVLNESQDVVAGVEYWDDDSPYAQYDENGLITMTVHEIIVEHHNLIVTCEFSAKNEKQEEINLMPRNMPWSMAISQDGQIVYRHTSDVDVDIYHPDDGTDSEIYIFNFRDFDGEQLINRKNTFSLYYLEPDDGFSFDFTPTQCYEEKYYDFSAEYQFPDREGALHTLTVSDVYEDALHFYLSMDYDASALETAVREDPRFPGRTWIRVGYGFALLDSSGNSLIYDGNGYIKPDNLEDGLTLRVSRSYYYIDEDSACVELLTETVAEFPIDLRQPTLWDRLFSSRKNS